MLDMDSGLPFKSFQLWEDWKMEGRRRSDSGPRCIMGYSLRSNSQGYMRLPQVRQPSMRKTGSFIPWNTQG